MRAPLPLRRLLLLLPLALLAGAVARAEDQAVEKANAIVTFRRGDTFAGEVSVMGGRGLTIAPTGANRQRSFRLADLLAIEHVPESATLEHPWTFKEAGKHEKIYFEGQYPLLNFLTTVRLVDGTTVQGHVISCVLELHGETVDEKLFFKRQIKGQLGQGLEAVDYVTSVRFPDHQPANAKRLSGTLTGAGKLLGASALDVERRNAITGAVRGDKFDFGNLLPGRYDVCLFTDRVALIGVSDAAPTALRGEPLAATDRAALDKVFPLADDFFKDRWIVALGGHRGFAKTLVYSRRADYYDADKFTPGGWLWHLEFWGWHYAEPDEWKVDGRYLQIRHRQVGGETVRKLYRVPALGAVEPGALLTLKGTDDERQDWQFIRNLD